MTVARSYLDVKTTEEALEVSKQVAQALIGKPARVLISVPGPESHGVILGLVHNCQPWPGSKLTIKGAKKTWAIPWQRVLYVMAF